MKKTSWLSLATAAAIVATSAGTFAAWDTMDATTVQKELTLRKPVMTTVAPIQEFILNNSLDIAPSATSTVNFTVADVPDAENANYTIKPTVTLYKNDGVTTIDASDISAVATLKTTPVNINGAHEVEIIVTANDTSAAKTLIDGTTSIKVEVKGVLIKKP